MNLKNLSVAIVTHRSIMPCIPGADLKKFALAHGCSNLLYITHPLLLLKESWGLSSERELYESKKGLKTSKFSHWIMPEILLYIKDIICSVVWTLNTKQIYDIYFGINNLNAFSGLVLKKLGKVRKVVYYTIDLYPERFTNPLVNWIYHQLDKFCVKHCDETWNVSPYLTKYREKQGITGTSYSRQFTVPIGIWFDDMQRIPSSKRKRSKIVYVGHLKDFYGVDLAINSLPLVRKEIPSAYLEIIGGGEEQATLEKLAEKNGISRFIKFYGWKEKKEAENIIADSAIGLAPFNTLIIDEKIKNGDPAKIKDYLALGVPVVMTNASLNASAIADAKCGIVIENYDAQEFADAIVKLLKNDKIWEEYQKNALVFIQKFDWNYLFSKNISRLI
ncbi:MAG: glycosyltransferase [Microgenomates group bacterium Gr01-1014_5]|nr:MAG: glycosyltransferase [Microgenomates group bacterium Gr01-1014_5]